MNDHEAQRIAAAFHQLRPDWPASSLLTLIRKNLLDRPRRDVAVALAWVACESGTATPARVLETGPWWRAAGVDGGGRQLEPYDVASVCGICEKPEHRCRANPYGAHEYESKVDVIRARRSVDEAPAGLFGRGASDEGDGDE